jgi:LacI family transcriptional regulator
VSTATVSYALNGGPRPVSAAARAAVLRAVDQLGYRPNRRARDRARRTRTIAAIVPAITNPLLASLVASIDAAALEAGYTVLVASAESSVDRQRDLIAHLAAMRADGVVVTARELRRDDLGPLRAAGVPAVVLASAIPDAQVDAVLVDHVDIGRQAAAHLLEHGHRLAACIAGPGGGERIEGYRQAHVLAGVPLDPGLVRRDDATAFAGRREALDLLRLRPRPTAIFATNEPIALGVLHAARSLGLRVPEDLAVVAADGTYLAAMAAPSLTTVAYPVAEMARLTVAMLLDRIRGNGPDAPRQLTFKATLIRSASCGCPAGDTTHEADASGLETAPAVPSTAI